MDRYSFQYCPKLVILSADHSATLLCKRRGEADYDGTFSFIGGKMEITDQTIIEGIAREKGEEVGNDFRVRLYSDMSLNVLFRKKDGSAMILPHYLAVYESGDVTLNPEEYSEYAWVTIAELDAFEPKIQNIPEIVKKLLQLTEMTTERDLVSM